MEIERTTFGTITIDGKTYEHDVIIRLSGEVARRKKKLSKKYYGTSHILSKDEAKFIYEDGCEQLILGSGQMGNVHLSPEAGQSRHSDCAPMTSGLPRLADNLRAAEPVANLIAEPAPSCEIGCFLLLKFIILRCTVFLTRTRCTNGKERGN